MLEDKKTLILENKKIHQKLDRMSREIHEKHYKQHKLFLLGVAQRGYQIADLLFQNLKGIHAHEVYLGKITMDKKNPIDAKIETDFEPELLKNAAVIIVDDVLESGRTLSYVARYVLNAPIQSLSTAILIDRMHPRYPIRADFVGLTLSTTLQEHISVEIDGKGRIEAFVE